MAQSSALLYALRHSECLIMDIIKDFLLLTVRIISLFPLLLIVTLFMGKRSVAELPVFDYLIVIALGAIAGADIADPNINHLHTAAATILIAILQRVVSMWTIKNRKLGKYITFEPTLVVQDGIFLVKNLRRIRYSVDTILQMLRENQVFDVGEVHLAIVEASGKLTVHKKPANQSVTLQDLGIQENGIGVSYPVIIEGKVHTEVLQAMNVTEGWLRQEILKQGILDLQEVFFASIDDKLQLRISTMKQTETGPQIIN